MKKLFLLALLSLPVIFFTACTSSSSSKDSSSQKTAPKSEQSNQDVSMRLFLPNTAFDLAPEYTSSEFAALVQKANSDKGQLQYNENKFVSPKIFGQLYFKNNSKKAVTLKMPNNEDVQLSFDLKGNGAVTINNMFPADKDDRVGTTVTLKPGEEAFWYVEYMDGGMRGQTQKTYWTKPGTYNLSIVYKSFSSDGNVVMTSAPVTVTVK